MSNQRFQAAAPMQSIPARKPQNSIDAIKSVLMKAGSIYIEAVSFTGLVAGGVQKQTFTNQDNIPFLIQQIAVYGRQTTDSAKSFNFKLSLKDSGRQQLWMSNPAHASAFGSGDLPTILAVPYLLRGSSTFEVECSNIGAVGLDIFVNFIGYKVNSISL